MDPAPIPEEDPTYLVVVSDPDPVASRVMERWGTPPATGDHVDGAAVRRLSERALVVRRPGPHIYDEHLDAHLPAALRTGSTTLVFPSVHRSESNVPCLTVHPLGNVGPTAEVGGRVRCLVPTDPSLMVSALRQLYAARSEVGLEATYEATHHGPELSAPAFFVEIGYGSERVPSEAAVVLLAEVIPSLRRLPGDRTAVAVGGGHYAPHFTMLALRRHWAFGHILSRHALVDLDRATAVEALRQTPGASGFVTARAEDAGIAAVRSMGVRLRDGDAPALGDATRASGT